MTPTQPTPPDAPTYAHDAHCNTTHTPGPDPCPPPDSWFTPHTSGLMAKTPHVLIPAGEHEQLTAVAEAARAYVASEATRHDDTIAHDEWLRGNRAALDALTAAVNALDAPEVSP